MSEEMSDEPGGDSTSLIDHRSSAAVPTPAPPPMPHPKPSTAPCGVEPHRAGERTQQDPPVPRPVGAGGNGAVAAEGRAEADVAAPPFEVHSHRIAATNGAGNINRHGRISHQPAGTSAPNRRAQRQANLVDARDRVPVRPVDPDDRGCSRAWTGPGEGGGHSGRSAG